MEVERGAHDLAERDRGLDGALVRQPAQDGGGDREGDPERGGRVPEDEGQRYRDQQRRQRAAHDAALQVAARLPEGRPDRLRDRRGCITHRLCMLARAVYETRNSSARVRWPWRRTRRATRRGTCACRCSQVAKFPRGLTPSAGGAVERTSRVRPSCRGRPAAQRPATHSGLQTSRACTAGGASTACSRPSTPHKSANFTSDASTYDQRGASMSGVRSMRG